MNLEDYKKIYFSGIGGISMSGLAEILLSKGFKVSGSDCTSSEITDHLKSIGIKVYIGQKSENIENDVDLFVHTAAIKSDNPEMVEAHKRNIKIIDRATLLGIMMKSYTYPISIAGTHGKTTTTSMLTEILLAADKNPTVTIGGILDSIGGNFKVGGNDFFVAESCEYCDSFLKFNPYSAIILNIDRDHTDYFKTMEQMYNSFNSFTKLLPQNGFVVINDETPDKEKITKDAKCKIITYGLTPSAEWYPKNVDFDENGNGSYTPIGNGKEYSKISLSVPGMYNVLNSIAAFALAINHGIEERAVVKGLKMFGGTHRRFELKGKFNGVTLIDDYAHHPTEIKSTLSAAKAHDVNKVWVVFQPHTYTRTKSLLTEFSEAFDAADKIAIVDIYAAREVDNGEIHSKTLVDNIKLRGKDAIYLESFEKAKKYFIDNCKPGDMLITMGAGDVYKIGDDILSTLSTDLSTH